MDMSGVAFLGAGTVFAGSIVAARSLGPSVMPHSWTHGETVLANEKKQVLGFFGGPLLALGGATTAIHGSHRLGAFHGSPTMLMTGIGLAAVGGTMLGAATRLDVPTK